MSYKPLSALSDLATNKNTNYVSKTPLLTEQAIEKAIDQFGVAPFLEWYFLKGTLHPGA